MKITYGIIENNIDVTDLCFNKLLNNNIITIPSGDMNRANLFTDPLIGVHKKIFIEHYGNVHEFDESTHVKIDLLNNKINYNNLSFIHSSLKLNYGSFNEELPEQKMAVRYLTGNEKVLEIGGNIGRNSLIIASILENHNNFVTLESDEDICKQLIENRNLNNFTFHIENSALSNRKLIQQGWNTIPSEILQTGFKWINTINYNQLKTKYNIDFDTLVLDCEGAFYYILMDMPEILNNIKLIIMENDYLDITHKNYIDEILIKNNFIVDYSERGGWGPCYNNFFEVWKKN
jgi:FkbM family methyltransferase